MPGRPLKRHTPTLWNLAWAGPVFWLYAYNDLFDYMFWPYDYYDDYYDPFWAYGYDDLFAGIETPA